MLVTLLGKDEYAALQRVRQLVGDTLAVRLQASDGVAAIAQSVGQPDLFGDSPPVVIDEIGQLKAGDQEQLAATLGVAVDSDQVVTVVVPADALPSDGPLRRVLEKGSIERLPKPTAAALSQWVKQEAQQRGIRVEMQALTGLIERLGGNKFALINELERLRWADEPALTIDGVGAVEPLNQEDKAFVAADAWLQRRTAVALSVVRRLWRQQVPAVLVVGAFERQARILYLIKRGLGSNQSLMAEMKVAGFAANKMSAAARKWTLPQSRQALRDLHDLDLGIKSGRLDAQAGVERWIISTSRPAPSRDGK